MLSLFKNFHLVKTISCIFFRNWWIRNCFEPQKYFSADVRGTILFGVEHLLKVARQLLQQINFMLMKGTLISCSCCEQNCSPFVILGDGNFFGAGTGLGSSPKARVLRKASRNRNLKSPVWDFGDGSWLWNWNWTELIKTTTLWP